MSLKLFSLVLRDSNSQTMYKLLLVAALIAGTTARPEGGYSYNPPVSNINLPNRYAVPGGNVGTFVSSVGGIQTGGHGFSSTGSVSYTGGHGIGGSVGGVHTGGHGIGGTVGGVYTGGHGIGGSVGGVYTGGHGIGGSVGGVHTGGHGIGGSVGGVHTGGHGIGGTVSTGSQITTGGQTSFGVNQGGLIHKHIYVHVAPPELELQQQQEIRATSAPQKHYKIIFIKTPTQSTSSVQQIQTQAQNQEKTLIYVLVKRPDDAQNVALTSSTSTQPSKPEVYFIRYKAAKETTGVSSGGTVSGGDIGGGTVSGGSFGAGFASGGGQGGGLDGGTSLTGLGGTKGPTPPDASAIVSGGNGIGGGFGSGIGGGAGGGISGGAGGGISGGVGGGSYTSGGQQSYGPPGQSGPYYY